MCWTCFGLVAVKIRSSPSDKFGCLCVPSVVAIRHLNPSGDHPSYGGERTPPPVTAISGGQRGKPQCSKPPYSPSDVDRIAIPPWPAIQIPRRGSPRCPHPRPAAASHNWSRGLGADRCAVLVVGVDGWTVAGGDGVGGEPRRAIVGFIAPGLAEQCLIVFVKHRFQRSTVVSNQQGAVATKPCGLRRKSMINSRAAAIPSVRNRGSSQWRRFQP